MKTAMDDGVTRVFEQYETKHKIQKFQDDLLEHQVLSLTRGECAANTRRKRASRPIQSADMGTAKAAAPGRKIVQ